MISIVALVLGVVFGWWRAAKRGGNRLDCMHYAAIHGILFFLIALGVTMITASML